MFMGLTVLGVNGSRLSKLIHPSHSGCVLAEVPDVHEFLLGHPFGVAVAEREILPERAMVVGDTVRVVIDVVRIHHRGGDDPGCD